jgi:hypothetical protein
MKSPSLLECHKHVYVRAAEPRLLEKFQNMFCSVGIYFMPGREHCLKGEQRTLPETQVRYGSMAEQGLSENMLKMFIFWRAY